MKKKKRIKNLELLVQYLIEKIKIMELPPFYERTPDNTNTTL